jgi:SpoVK/Ycf46/Vps4 family AAA+-type ATPase
MSPYNTFGQYDGKSNVAKMVHMVFKIAKAHQPAVIYIDDFDKIFAKKAKDDLYDSKRVKKDLLKQMKNLSNKDRVLLVACCKKPWESDPKAFLSSFKKVIYCTSPDYSSRELLWDHFIAETFPDHESIDIGILAKLSGGMSAGNIRNCCQYTLTDCRLMLQRWKPITTEDFVKNIPLFKPLNKDEEVAGKVLHFIIHEQDFYDKLSLSKKRKEMLAGAAEGNDKKPEKKK